MTRRRLTVPLALVAFAMVAAFALADSVVFVSEPSSDRSERETSGYIGGTAGTPLLAPDSGEEAPYTGGLQERLPGSSQPDKAKGCKADKRCGKKKGDEEGEETVDTIAATFAPAGGDDSDGGLVPQCGDADSCVGEIQQVIPRVRERVADLPLIDECTSSIGGEALCIDFGDGNYLVADGPADGEAELGFCTPAGYYHVSGPALEGGTGGNCPDEHGKDDGDDEAPTVSECTSSSGGDAKCFEFGDGSYIVNDPFADGGGEVGFCTDSGYYYVSVPSATGEAGAECPDAQ